MLLIRMGEGFWSSAHQYELGEQKLSVVRTTDDLLRSMIDQETGLRGYIVTNNTAFLQPFEQGRPQYLASLHSLTTELPTADFPHAAVALTDVAGQADAWYRGYALLQIQRMQHKQVTLARSEASSAEGKKRFDQFRAAIALLQQHEAQDLGTVQQREDQVTTAALIFSFVLSLLAIGVLCWTFLGFFQKLATQLQILREGAEALGAGKLSTRLPDLAYQELVHLAQSFNSMAQSLGRQQQAMQERDILENVLQLNAILTASLDFQTLAYAFLTKALTTANLHLGAIYLYDREQEVLTLSTALGFERSSLQSTFEPGEGTVGRAALSREPIYLTFTPEQQRDFTVKTMFGAVVPASSYYLPLLRGDELLGVLAVASVVPMPEKTRNLLNVVSSNLATAISNTRAYDQIRQQTQELQERSQEQAQANLTLRMQRQELEATFEAITDAVVVYDRNGGMQRFNQVGQQLLEISDTSQHVKNQTAMQRSSRYQVFDESGGAIASEQWPVMQVLAGQIISSQNARDVQIQMPSGRAYQINITGSPLRDADGAITGAVCVMRDVTERWRIEQALRLQRDELLTLNQALEEANRARSQFLSTMSHELRTPLTSIIGFSQILLNPQMSSTFKPGQVKQLERILRNGKHLLSLINDILDLSKIDAGRMDVSRDTVQVPELVTSIVEEMQPQAQERQLQLHITLEEGIDTITTDVRKLKQILLNLLSNALKFTEAGEVQIHVSRVHDMTTQEERLAIAVRDSGIGMTPAQLEHIFDAFYQAESGNSRKYGGTGLGLSIVQQLARLLGGSVEVESTPGEGSTFTLILPFITPVVTLAYEPLRLHPLTEAAEKKSIVAMSTSTRLPMVMDTLFAVSASRSNAAIGELVVLAIDDNPDVLSLIEASLKETPYRVVGVSNPREALAVVQQVQPAAITLDVMMPELNGWQVLHQLKSTPQTANIPVVMLTIVAEQSTGYVLGADDYLLKPFDRPSLLQVLQRLIAPPSSFNEQEQLVEP